MNGPAHYAPDGQVLVIADMEVFAAVAGSAQNNAFRRMAQLPDREIAVNDGNDNALIYRIDRAIDNQEVAVTDTEVGHRAGCGDEKRGFPVQDEMLVEAEPIFSVIRGGGWEAHGARV